MRKIAILSAVAALALPASASAAGNSTCQAYNPETCIGTTGPNGTPSGNGIVSSSSTGRNGTLPFTGLDVGELLVAAGALGAAGVGLRRISAQR